MTAPRICLISYREMDRSPAQHCFNVLEDALVRCHGAQVLLPQVTHRALTLSRRLRWFPRRLRSDAIPRCDLLIVCGMGFPDAWVLEAFLGWRDRARHVVFYCMDSFPWQHPWARVLERLPVDTVLLSHREAVLPLRARLEQPVSWLPYCVPDGMIDEAIADERPREPLIVSYGRHAEAQLEACRAASGAVRVQRLDRSLAPDGEALVRWLLRATAVQCNPVAETDPARAGGTNPTTYRYFEALGAGAIPLGGKPHRLEYQALFPLEHTLVDLPVVPTAGEVRAAMDEVTRLATDVIGRRARTEWMRSHHAASRRASELVEHCLGARINPWDEAVSG